MPKQRIVLSIIGVLMLSLTVSAELKVYSYGIDSAVRGASKDASPAQSSVIRPSSVVATSTSEDLVVTAFWYVNSGVSSSDGVSVVRVAFNNFLFDSAYGSLSVSDISLLSSEPPAIKRGYFYPNPMRFSEGKGVLNYYLTQNMDIEIHLYDIFGRKIWSKRCAATDTCGMQGNRNLKFGPDADSELNGHQLSAGVYFYLFFRQALEAKVLHYSCDFCQRPIDPAVCIRHVVKINVFPAVDSPNEKSCLPESESLGDDHLDDMDDLLERLEEQDLAAFLDDGTRSLPAHAGHHCRGKRSDQPIKT